MKRVCAYCRVSTEKTDQENSLSNQRSYFERTINENDEYILYNIYADKGISGTKLNRPEFDKMLNDAGLQRSIDAETGEPTDAYIIVAPPKFDLILVKNTSRFARNVSVDIILKTLVKNNVFVYFLDLDKTTEKSEDITYIQIFSTFDERDSRDRSKKVKFGMLEGAKNHMIYTNTHIYGYKYHPKPENRLEIIPIEAEIVRKIYSYYLSGLGSCMVAKKLAEEGILTRQGKPFSSSTVLSILKNEKYIGVANGMRFSRGELFGNKRLQQKTLDEQIRFKTDKIPAIIDEETFKKAQAKRESCTSHKINKGRYIGKTDFAHKIVCGNCGAFYQACGTKQTKSGMKRYYCCAKRYRPDVDDNNNLVPCMNPVVSQSKIDGKISSVGLAFMMNRRESYLNSQLKVVREQLVKSIDKSNEKQIGKLKNELVEVKKIKEKLLDEYLLNSYSEEYLKSKLKGFDLKEEALIGEIKNLSKSNEDIYRDIKDIDETINDLKMRKKIFEEELFTKEGRHKFTRKELLQKLDRVTVLENGDIRVEFKDFNAVKQLREKYKYLLQTV